MKASTGKQGTGSPGVFVVQLLSFAKNSSFKAYLTPPALRRLFILCLSFVFLKMKGNFCSSVKKGREKKKKKISSPPKTTPVLKNIKSEVSSGGDEREKEKVVQLFYPACSQTALYQKEDAFPHPPFSQFRKLTPQPFLNTLEIYKTAVNSTLKK